MGKIRRRQEIYQNVALNKSLLVQLKQGRPWPAIGDEELEAEE